MRQVLGHREHDKPVPAGQVVVQVGCREEKGGARHENRRFMDGKIMNRLQRVIIGLFTDFSE